MPRGGWRAQRFGISGRSGFVWWIQIVLLGTLLFLSVSFAAVSGNSLASGKAAHVAEVPDAVASSPTPEPLTAFSGTVTSRSMPSSAGIGVDLGNNSFSYSASKISWARSDGNMTLELSSLSLASVPVPLTGMKSLKNSSVVEQSFSASSVPAGGTSCSPSIQLAFRNMTGISAYDRDVVLSGSLGCNVSGAVLSLRLVNALGFPVSNCDTGSVPNACDSVFFGSMGFSWAGAEALDPVYNNATQTLSFTPGPSFSVDPIAVDGSGTCTGDLVTTCTLSLTTKNSNDVLIIGQSALNTCATPTSSPSLTWTLRKDVSYGLGANECMYYAVWSSSGSVSITCQFSSSTRFGCVGFGVTDANTTSIFDGNSAVPCSATGTGSPASCNLSTSNPNDLILGLMGQNASPTNTAGSGFIELCTSVSGVRAQCDEDTSVDSTQSGLSVSYSWSGSTVEWAIIGDAIKQAYVTLPIDCTTENSAPAATVTLSGGDISPTTLTCDANTHDFTVDPSQVLVLTVPPDGSTSRYRLPSGATSMLGGSCASGTCSTAYVTIYYQYSQSVSYAIDSCDSGATCNSPDLTYTQWGSQTQSPLSTTVSTFWVDYATTASVPSPYSDSLGNLYYPHAYSWSITAANVISNPIVYWCGL